MSSKLGASLLGRGGALNHSGPGDDVLELDYDADIGAIAQAITPGGHDAKPKGAPGGTPFLVSCGRFRKAMQLSPPALTGSPGASPIPPIGARSLASAHRAGSGAASGLLRRLMSCGAGFCAGCNSAEAAVPTTMTVDVCVGGR